MKKINSSIRAFLFSLLLLTGVFASFSFRSAAGSGDCDPDTLLENCASDLDDFVFVKSFEIKTKKVEDKVEYSYVLSRDVTYRIVTCEPNKQNKNMVVKLFDRSHKLISTNFIKAQKKIYPTMSYKCAATGVYYLEASFEGQENGCGLNIIGFKK